MSLHLLEYAFYAGLPSAFHGFCGGLYLQEGSSAQAGILHESSWLERSHTHKPLQTSLKDAHRLLHNFLGKFSELTTDETDLKELHKAALLSQTITAMADPCLSHDFIFPDRRRYACPCIEQISHCKYHQACS